MSKFNNTKVSGPKEINYMGEKSYKISDKESLTFTVLTTFLNNSYYMSENEIINKIIDLTGKVGYEFAAKLAIYARKNANMRSSSHLLASLVCKDESHPSWLKDFYNEIVVRPDDMSEILCAYAKFNDIDLTKSFKKIPNSMKKGFKKALERLSPYQIDKYKMNNKEISLIDLVNLFHPKATTLNSEAYRRLIHGESLVGTYDSKILEKEMTVSCQKEDMTEDDKVLAKHDSIVSVLKSRMPIMNLLRNLHNIMLYAPDAVDMAIEQLTNRDAILHSKQLPFRFASAYSTIENISIEEYNEKTISKSEILFEDEKPSMTLEKLSELKIKVLNAIEKAMEISCENIPMLNGNCAILIDHSGSVRGDSYSNSKVSPFSKTTTAMIGNLFGSMLAFKQKNVYIGMFGDKLIPVNIDRSKGLLEMNSQSFKDGGKCGGRTENGLYEFMKNVISEKKKIDNLIIFSDMEIGNNGEGGWDYTSSTGGIHFHELFSQFKKINPDCLTICCNINAQSGTSVFNPNLKILNIAGWSNNIFNVIDNYQTGKIKSLVEEIEKISFNSSKTMV